MLVRQDLRKLSELLEDCNDQLDFAFVSEKTLGESVPGSPLADAITKALMTALSLRGKLDAMKAILYP